MKRFALMLLCAPADVLGLLVLGLVSLCSRGEWLRFGLVLVWRPAPSSWVARRWPYSTTFGHAVLWHPAHGAKVLVHELQHVCHFEASCCAWALACAASQSLTLVHLWPIAWPVAYAGASLASWLIGGDWYLGNVFERHARKESGS